MTAHHDGLGRRHGTRPEVLQSIPLGEGAIGYGTICILYLSFFVLLFPLHSPNSTHLCFHCEYSICLSSDLVHTSKDPLRSHSLKTASQPITGLHGDPKAKHHVPQTHAMTPLFVPHTSLEHTLFLPVSNYGEAEKAKVVFYKTAWYVWQPE